MSKTTERRGISRVNVILVSVFLAGALICAVTGNVPGALVLATFGVLGLAGAVHAARPGARDVTRINGLEYRDERDGRLAQQGFAVVGVAALVISVAAFVATTLMGRIDWFIWGQTMALAIVWGVANSVVVRRS
jgi:MFS family permease